MSTEKEKQLLLRVSKGEKDAFSILFYSYNAKLYSFIHRITGSKELSKDILQDVFFKIWKNREQLRDVNNFNAYLFTIAKHHAFNQLKRKARETLIRQYKPGTKPGHNSPEEQLQYKNLERAITDIVNTLPPRQQEAYKLSREAHLKQADIAQQMQLSVSTVQNHLNRALKTIREKLEKYYPISCLLSIWIIRFLK